MVEQLREEAESKGGIHIPELARQTLPVAEILALGPGLGGSGLAVGDLVFFHKFSGHEVEYRGRKVVFLESPDILGTAQVEEKIDDNASADVPSSGHPTE